MQHEQETKLFIEHVHEARENMLKQCEIIHAINQRIKAINGGFKLILK